MGMDPYLLRSSPYAPTFRSSSPNKKQRKMRLVQINPFPKFRLFQTERVWRRQF